MLEATLEIIDQDLIVGIQDMGAAGLTCSSSEMSAKGNAGIEIEIDKVPIRESRMSPYEILLSESQERMLVCVKKGKESAVKAVFDKWGLDSTIIGKVTDDGMMDVKLHGETVARIPSHDLVLGGGAPIYHRETKKPAHIEALHTIDFTKYPLTQNWNETLLTLLSSPNLCHKGWVFEQYDTMVRTNTVVGPGSDAAVIRLRKTDKALAMKTDCNARYCYLNPRFGAQIAVAESARNIVCSGGQPLGVTNCLNFGNPYKPEVYYAFAETIAGMGEACTVFGTPVTGGNVSFYNEDPTRAVFPTPTIGMIGLVNHLRDITTLSFRDEGDVILLLGVNREELGASEYLHSIHNETRGPVPLLDLAFEKKLQDSALAAIRRQLIKSAHDVSDGGLAIALAECCIGDRERQIGATIRLDDSLRADCLLFGESQSRIIVTCERNDLATLFEHFSLTKIPAKEIGRVGGERLKINSLIDQPLSVLSEAFYNAMPRFMDKVG